MDTPTLLPRLQLEDGRLVGYAPLPALVQSSRGSPEPSRSSGVVISPRKEVQQSMQDAFAKREYFDPFAK